MPKRMNTKRYQISMNAVIARDGDICLLCHQSPVKRKTLDHVNCLKRENDLTNLALLCHRCNTTEGNRARRGRKRLTPVTMQDYQDKAKEALLKAPGTLPTHSHTHTKAPGDIGGAMEENRMEIPRNQGRYLQRVNAPSSYQMDSLFRFWLFRFVAGHGFVSREEGIHGGAEYLDQHLGGGSTVTVGRYFDKVSSPEGWLVEDRDSLGRIVWKFKAGEDLTELEQRLMGRCG